MSRWLGLVIAVGLVASPIAADAQVFKPKGGKKADVGAKAPEKKAAKKTSKASPKKAAPKARKGADAPSKKDDPDFVKITDDDEIE